MHLILEVGLGALNICATHSGTLFLGGVNSTVVPCSFSFIVLFPYFCYSELLLI